MSDQDTETPTQLIQKRLQYHWDFIENVKPDSDLYKIHYEMALKYSQAYSILTGSWTLSSALDKIFTCLEKLPVEVAERVIELEKLEE